MLAYSSIENMGIITLGIAVGGIGIYAAMLHLLAHSLIKSSFFLTAGNILKLFKTKKIDEISGILKIDKVTGWLWVLCFAGMAGLPPSPLFLSEFLLLKAMLEKNQIMLAVIFAFLLTVIIYGMGKAIIKMSFGDVKAHNAAQDLSVKELHSSMYLPQIVFVTLSLILGICMPSYINQLIHNAVLAISSM